MGKFIKVLVLLSVTLLFLVSCIPGDGKATADNPANLLWGIWHGWLAPLSLIISLFRDGINIYEVHNSGFWYNLGFYAGILGGFGSLSLSRNKRKEKDCSR